MKKTALLLMINLFYSNSFAQLKPINYSDGPTALQGLFAKPQKPLKDKPGILILPAWMGINDHSKEMAQKLADLGYHAFVADIYGVDNNPKNTQEAGQKAGYFKKNYADYQHRTQLALNQLIAKGADASKIVVIGYCFGGTGALEAARGQLNIVGVVSFHGGLGKDSARENEPLKAKVLVLHGADDPYVNETEVKSFQQEMKNSNADWQMIYYADAVHAFTEKAAGNDPSKGAAYNELADKRSFQHLLVFLKDVL
jgi:dienelactone hydrolase